MRPCPLESRTPRVISTRRTHPKLTSNHPPPAKHSRSRRVLFHQRQLLYPLPLDCLNSCPLFKPSPSLHPFVDPLPPHQRRSFSLPPQRVQLRPSLQVILSLGMQATLLPLSHRSSPSISSRHRSSPSSSVRLRRLTRSSPRPGSWGARGGSRGVQIVWPLDLEGERKGRG